MKHYWKNPNPNISNPRTVILKQGVRAPRSAMRAFEECHKMCEDMSR